jgi:hypothetical protein
MLICCNLYTVLDLTYTTHATMTTTVYRSGRQQKQPLTTYCIICQTTTSHNQIQLSGVHALQHLCLHQSKVLHLHSLVSCILSLIWTKVDVSIHLVYGLFGGPMQGKSNDYSTPFYNALQHLFHSLQQS